MVCTGNNTVASPAFCNINAESGCVYNHAIRQLFYYPVENKTNTENICNYDNHYSYGYGNGYTSTVTEKLTPIYCCDSTRKDLLLKYTDPTGEWVHLVVGAVIGAINGAIMAARSDAKGWEWVGYIGIGAAAGALSAGVANGASVALAGAGGTFGMGFVGNAYSIAQFGFMQGAVIGAAAGFTAGFIGGAGYSWMGGANFGQGLENGLKAGGWGALSGAVVGGLTTGISASLNGRRFWDGDYTLQQKLDIMMAQYKPELLESIGEADAEVLVGNNKNLKQHGAFNRKGDIVVNKDGQEVIVHGVARQGTINREELPFGYGYNNNKIALSKNTVRNLWNGDMDAKGTLFHEWCHARDYHTGVFRYLSKNYPNQWKSLMEVRAYQFNPNSSWAQYYHRLVYPLQILKGR